MKFTRPLTLHAFATITRPQNLAVLAAMGGVLLAQGPTDQARPIIPKAWDDREVASFEVPLAQPDRSPRYLSSAEYYALEVVPIYRGYPVYKSGKEPAGYIDSLKLKAPEIIFDPRTLRTEQDWIHAGETVFDAPTNFIPVATAIALRPDVIESLNIRSTRDGIIPYFQYVVRTKGVVELGIEACAICHTRILPDGTLSKGAQGDFPWAQRDAWVAARRTSPDRDRQARDLERSMFAAPWVEKAEELYASTVAEMGRRSAAMQPGVIAREGTSSAYPAHVPSLIGIKDIRYFDATGLTRHRSIADLMRYAVVNRGGTRGLQMTARFGEFQPTQMILQRYSDEQLYALAKFLYSLEPPPNPNPFDDNARRGLRVFQQQGCSACHTPPLYTNNKLTPANGFPVPDRLRKSDQILDVSVRTDTGLATRTRRGTGFYKVPSLRGVWFRNAFGHNGQAETLEEWLDPARLRDDYLPKGFHLSPGPIGGHKFGLNIMQGDKAALIGFLKTL